MWRTAVNQGIRNFSVNSPVIKCNRLQGKTAIVTASTDGIGFAIARRLAQEGAKVMVSSRKDSNVKKAVEQLQSEGLETKEKFGGLDILVSNAAANPGFTTLFETPEATWDKIFEVNVKSGFLLMQESLPLLRESKSSSIIFISSIAAYQQMTALGVYAVSKTALLGLNNIAAATLVSEGIRVNCIAPGFIKTKFSQPLIEGDFHEATVSTIPMRKIGEPDEIAGVAAFLASDDAAYITGETIVAAGGMQSRL
ncbi:dehydrogenase/reductase SDR family member 4 isoform X2 [Megalopta genalis]|uniref:dehydrogenase/reductase SDR family member 4 isoform X2 n=1 Tax=Megalopta genalis TaxID=115081 RepID=UPI003FD1F206